MSATVLKFRPLTEEEKARRGEHIPLGEIVPIKQNEPQPVTDCLLAAVGYTKRGWHVFPAPPGEKKSYLSANYSDGRKWGATNDYHQAGKSFLQFPNAGVGIVTGSSSGIWVLDADTSEGHGVDGIASMKDLEDEHGPLPLTLMAQSPSGSVHWYWKLPNSGTVIKNSTAQVAPGVDVRGEGGMVLAPPTIKPGRGAYRWLNDVPIADAPAWLLERALTKASSDEGEHQAGEPEADIRDIAAAMAVIPNDGVDWEAWNNTGMAIYRATGGSDEGFRIFDDWSNDPKNTTPTTHGTSGTSSAAVHRTRLEPARSSIGRTRRARTGNGRASARPSAGRSPHSLTSVLTRRRSRPATGSMGGT
jgi:hypothetical protein